MPPAFDGSSSSGRAVGRRGFLCEQRNRIRFVKHPGNTRADQFRCCSGIRRGLATAGRARTVKNAKGKFAIAFPSLARRMGVMVFVTVPKQVCC